ncbi:DUF6929 family protein [Aquirhabdus parva]|uniref:Phytase-like domain-containing protein n=1 Tax=Aquirhabdus parva TaxID=2283318 RepID=A0A345P458_9GAMM|nr:hypothetical protein [Aquirhabdus parva]AXI02067.1 hypothetical protein HYN46_03845 [Aquirhabdus parva]
MKINILERRALKGIGALSGVATHANTLYVVGDDAGYLLKTSLHQTLNQIIDFEKVPLLTHTPLTPLSKAEKPDFESMTIVNVDGQAQLLIMGSGSKANRKTALLFNPLTQQVGPFLDTPNYDFLESNQNLTGGAELNIEAVCSDDQHLYIFQRGNINRHHGVLVFDLKLLADTHDLRSTLVSVLSLHLPDIDGSASGISDACFLKHRSIIAAVASVEQTINTYDDGAVLGSLIVLLSTDGKTLDAQVITDDQGHPTPIKVEGITWLNTHPSGEEFLLVTDSDGGDSELLRVLVVID